MMMRFQFNSTSTFFVNDKLTKLATISQTFYTVTHWFNAYIFLGLCRLEFHHVSIQ